MIIKEFNPFQIEVKNIFKEHFDFDLEINFKPCLKNDLLQTDVLITLAKKLKCSPKEIFSKISDNNLSWTLREEQGFLFFKPKNPFTYSRLNFDIDNISSKNFIECYFIPNQELQEITLVRLKSLFYNLFFLREIFNLKTTLYFPNADLSFIPINSSSELIAFDFCSPRFFIKNDEEVLVNSNNDSEKIVFSVKDAFNVAYNLSVKLKATSVYIPKCFLSKHNFTQDISLVKNSFIENPISTSLYLTKDILNNDLDPFVIDSNEQVNVLSLASTTYALMKALNLSNLSSGEAKECVDLEEKVKLASLRCILLFESAITSGEIYEFIASLNDYLVLFQKFYNSPKIRQKIEENQLNNYELSLITGVFELLNLCNTELSIF